MIRKVLATAVLLPTSLSCFALGPYIGIGFGPDLIDFQQNAHISQPGNFDAIDKSHLAGNGVFGTLFGGYAWMYNWFYLAAEVNGNISSARFKSANYEYLHGSFSDTSYKIDSSYGFSALPGFILSDTVLIYARLAYSNGHFKTKTTDISLANVSRNLDGFKAGVGFKHSITPHWGVRMEYSYTSYDKTTFATFDALSSTTKVTNIHPQANQVEFSLIYNFDAPVMVVEK